MTVVVTLFGLSNHVQLLN